MYDYSINQVLCSSLLCSCVVCCYSECILVYPPIHGYVYISLHSLSTDDRLRTTERFSSERRIFENYKMEF